MAEMTSQQAIDLALQHHRAGRLQEAKDLYRQILSRDPGNPIAIHFLGVIAMQVGRYDIALDLIKKAIAIQPGYAEACNSLGNTYMAMGDAAEAAVSYRKAIVLSPGYAEARNNIASALKETGQLDEAIDEYRQAIALNPALSEVLSNLGGALRERGDLTQAISSYRRSLSIDPRSPTTHSALLLAMLLDPDQTSERVIDEHRRWNRQHAETLSKVVQPRPRDKRLDRPLKIGYVSPDFRYHVVGKNVLSLLTHHDHGNFETTCYGEVRRPDAMAAAIQQKCDRWRNTVGLSDDRLALQIVEDQIDILVDLALHTSNNRLLVFARKPAPVQITYLGYCGTTGLSSMDYRLSDPFLDPPGMDLSIYAETTIHLQSSYWCYEPEPRAPEPGDPPVLSKGSITFGCLNDFSKVSSAALDLWAKILSAVSVSRLILYAKPGLGRQRAIDHLAGAGIDAGRIEFVGPQPYLGYLRTYNQIDIALDPLPYTGGITSCDSLWMGVPFVTLAGKGSATGRGGYSILKNVGIEELIGYDDADYVSIAVELAKNLPQLADYRKTLRGRMQHSPLMDIEKLTLNIESIYRQVWQTWCDTTTSTGA